MSVTRSGKGSLNLKNPSKAKLRKIGEKGRQAQRESKAYNSNTPF